MDQSSYVDAEKGGTDVEEESGYYLVASPRVFDEGGDEVKGVGGVPSGSTAKVVSSE